LALLAVSSPSTAQQSVYQSEPCKWIDATLLRIQTLKPGMTRGDLIKLFTIEGGMYNRKHRTYVLRECPYIHLNVDFDPVGLDPTPNAGIGRPEDKIVNISVPYLYWGVAE
jgi:hypothetical protein